MAEPSVAEGDDSFDGLVPSAKLRSLFFPLNSLQNKNAVARIFLPVWLVGHREKRVISALRRNEATPE
jgi:hypothetical protein